MIIGEDSNVAHNYDHALQTNPTLFIHSITYAQVNFQKKILNDRYYSTVYAMSICSADLDGDGDIDVLSASYYDNKIAWYENTNGEGSISSQKIITTDIDRPTSVITADLDGDGDIDVLSSSHNDNKIAWYENIDGLGNFSSPKIITTDSFSPRKK